MTDLFSSRRDKADTRYVANYIFLPTQKMFDKHVDDILKMKYWVTDTETTGTDFLVDKVIMIQLGNAQKQYLIDARYVHNLRGVQEKLEDESFTKILHNAIFDYLMLKGTYGFSMEGMICTQRNEEILRCGLMKHGFSMAACALRYLGVVVDKEQQTSFIGHKGEFTSKQKNYAALDCVYPDHYAFKQLQLIKERGLQETMKIESNAIPAFGDMEYHGMLLNQEAWLKTMREEKELMEKARETFEIEACKHIKGDLFGGSGVSITSGPQIIDLFKNVFSPEDLIPADSKKKGEVKYSADKEILEGLCYKYKDPAVVTSLRAFRKHHKRVSTYGMSYIDHVHPVTGRFHPKVAQIGTETGRPAGRKPGMLNIPSVPAYRHPWIAGLKRKMLTNDYGACELRIMASMSGDPVMCKGFNEGVDYHTYTVTQFITDNEPYERVYIPHPKGEPGKGKLGDFIYDQDGNKVPNKYFGKLVTYDRVTSAQRKVAKAINFGLAYGMGAFKLSRDLKITLEKAREYVNKFNTTFAVLVAWLKSQQESALKNLYAETFLGRKRYFRPVKEPMWKKEWMSIRFDRNNPFDENMPEPLQKYHAQRAAIKREGGNSPIQGGNADITKIAMYRLRKWIKDYEREHNGGKYLAHIALQVYDEIIVDCPEELAELFAKKMDQIMREAGEEVIKLVPVETGCIIADSWVKG